MLTSGTPLPSRTSVLVGDAKLRKPRQPWFWETLIATTILAAISFRQFSSITALDIATILLTIVVFGYAWKHPDLKRFLTLIILWLVAILLSDQTNNVQLTTTTSSMVLPVLLGLSTVMLAWLARGSLSRLRAVVIGAAASHIIYVVVYGTTYFAVNPWKYGLALPATVLALALVVGNTKLRIRLAVAVLAASGVYSFVNDFRSMSGLALAAIIIAFFLRRPPKVERKFPMAKLFVGLLIIGYATYGAYALAASEGLLPAEAAAKYQSQVRGNLLIAARPEVVGSFYAIKSSPLIGVGTGGALDGESRSEALITLYKAGATIDREQQVRLFENGINSHSLLFSGWVSAGILGALPWVFVIYLAMRAIVRRRPGGGFAPLVIFWALVTAWDVLFSPYQPHLHVMLAAFLVLAAWKDPGSVTPTPEPQMADTKVSVPVTRRSYLLP